MGEVIGAETVRSHRVQEGFRARTMRWGREESLQGSHRTREGLAQKCIARQSWNSWTRAAASSKDTSRGHHQSQSLFRTQAGKWEVEASRRREAEQGKWVRSTKSTRGKKNKLTCKSKTSNLLSGIPKGLQKRGSLWLGLRDARWSMKTGLNPNPANLAGVSWSSEHLEKVMGRWAFGKQCQEGRVFQHLWWFNVLYTPEIEHRYDVWFIHVHKVALAQTTICRDDKLTT